MKKLNFMVLLFLVSVQLMAQESSGASASSATKGRFGIYGGMNMANIGGDSDSYDESLTGFQLGLMYCMYSSGGIFSCWVEPGYNAIGSKYNDTYSVGGGNQNITGSVSLGYVMVPVIARFQTQMGLFGDIGVQPQLLVSAKDKYEGNKDDYKDYVNGFDVGIPVGVGYEYKKKVGLSARYYMGVSNINKMDTDSKDHNSVFSLRLHVKL